MRAKRRRTFYAGHCCAMAIAVASVARADVGPPVEIRMPANTNQAVSGQAYAGVFEVELFEPGTLEGIKVTGQGWAVTSVEIPALRGASPRGVIRIPFHATPQNGDEPIGLTLTFNGRRVSRSYEIGPRYFGQVGKRHRAVSINVFGAPIAGAAAAPNGEQADRSSRGETLASAQSGLRVEGRIVYTRQCRDMSSPADGDCNDPEDIPARVVGADRIDVRVWDSDTIGHEEIWSGYTDAEGFFDTGVVDWVDSGDDPDLVV